MTEITIKVGSVTNAQKGKRLLTQNGYSCNIRRSIKLPKGEGCGYSLITNCERGQAFLLFKKAGIRIISAE